MARTEFPAKATHAQTRAHNASLVLRALVRPGPDQPRGDRPTHRPDPDLGRGAGRGAGRRRPGAGGRARPLDRRQGADPRLADRRRAAHGHARPRRADVHGRPPQPARGEIRARASRDLEGADGDAAVALVHDLIDELLAGPHSPILGIGVGTPGIVDGDGTIRWAVNLAWTDLPLGQRLADHYNLPTVVANDSRAAAYATFLFEGEDRPANLIAIKVGHGIGAGLVLNGELFGGDGFGAGEIGHIVIEPDGAPCHCGRFGCLETVASVPAILRRAFELAAERGTRIPQSIEAIAAAAAAGDELMLGIVRSAGRALGMAHREPDRRARCAADRRPRQRDRPGEPWLEAIRDEARRRTLATLARDTEVVNGGPGDDAVLLGTCALLLTRELGLTVRR